MKQTIIILLLLFGFEFGNAQVSNPDSVVSLTKQDYLLKSKKQTATGWFLLGGGIVVGTIGTEIVIKESGRGANNIINSIVDPNNPTPGVNKSRINSGLSMMLLGGLCSLGSIPVFVSAGHSRKKAAEMSFSPQMVPGLNGQLANGHLIPSLSVKLHL